MTTKTTISLRVLVLASVALFIILLTLLGHKGTEQHCPEIAIEGLDGEEVPGPVRLLVAEPQELPPFERLVQLREADRSILLRLYEAASDLSCRRALVWALGYLGGQEVADRFLQALTTEFKDETLAERQEDTLCDTVRALGYVAESNDDAYAFLKRASYPSFWQKARRWQSPRGDYSDSLLTSYSIQAVATSGRVDALSFLESLKAQPRRYLHAFAGDVAQGMFYLHLRQEGGARLLMQYMLTPRDKTLFEEWIRTDQGALWLEWANDQMRGPVPDE